MLIPRPAAITIAAGLLTVTAGTAGLLVTRHSTAALLPLPAGVATVPAPAGPIVAPPTSARVTAKPVARPVFLTIPVIGVRTRLVRLGLTAGGALQVPSSPSVAGWYKESPRPGAIGPAVIAGHVDSLTGPAVFYRLSELQAGDRIYIRRGDGSTVEFRVTAVDIYLKHYFPTASVYGATPDPELRLITCGGTFDWATRHYLSNTIVYATEVRASPRPAPHTRNRA